LNSSPLDFAEARDTSLETIRVLARDFKHRHTGLGDERRCAEYIAKRLSNRGIEADTFAVKVTGWKIKGKPSLQIRSPEERDLEFGPVVYSDSTDQDGIVGSLAYEGTVNLMGSFPCTRFSIRSEGGKCVGNIFGRDEGLAIVQPHIVAGNLEPSAIIGSSDNLAMLRAMESHSKTNVRLRYTCEAQFEPQTETLRVEGIIQGRKKPEEIIVVNAHLDSQGAEGVPEAVDSCGAVDDAAGCAVLLEFANYCRQRGTDRTIIFSATCGEEWGKIGARSFAQHLDKIGLTPKIAAFVNIDAICFRGAKELIINASGGELGPQSYNMNEICKRALKKAGLKRENRIRVTEWSPPRGFDQQAFYERGVPVATIFTHNDLYYHRSSDMIPRSVDEQLLLRAIEYYYYMLVAVAN